MSSMTDFLKAIDNKFASIADDGIAAGDIAGYIDTGSYALNALVSGSIYGGLPNNKITLCGAPSSTGKTFIALGCANGFQQNNPKGIVMVFESESAITKGMLVDRGIDPKRAIIIPVTTVEGFRTQALKMVQHYNSLSEKDREPLFFILDSMGMLSTEKELTDVAAGSGTKDMTRAALLKATFRVLTLELGRAGIPLFVTNHVYDAIGQGPYAAQVQGGGCLVAGTKIKMADGSLKNIEDVQVGESVQTYGGDTSTVADTFSFDDKEVYEIEFEDGSVISCSAEHRFMVDGEWVEARDLVNGQDCETA